MKVYLDANFFVFMELDKTGKGDQARAILREIISGKKQAITSILSLDEAMWVFFKNKYAGKLRNLLDDIYSIPHLKLISGSSLIPLRALDFIEEHKLKPRDAFHAAFMQEENVHIIVSDDADFDRVKGIQRISL